MTEEESAIQIMRTAFVDKGAQLELRCIKDKISIFSSLRFDFKLKYITCSFASKVLGLFNIGPNAVHTCRKPTVTKFST